MNLIEEHQVKCLKLPTRLQDYALTNFNYISTKSALKKAIKRKQILINHQPASTATWLENGMLISYISTENASPKVFRLKIEVVYEDHFLAVINKPAGFPTNGNYFKTIERALPFNLKKSDLPDALNFPVPVHRLDNQTQGLLLVAKTIQAKSLLSKAFQNQEIKKCYRAICFGGFSEKTIEINEPIDTHQAKTIISVEDSRVIQSQYFSLLHLTPITGRTHQLRKHLQFIQHPILGDQLYQGDFCTKLAHQGLYLQSFQLEFFHPFCKQLRKINIDLPKKFTKFIELN
ncbi:RluA family pseudouridine synthase [Psychroflexus sp. ALD_RP9]|uniref:RluA family pseudouridine synthase n=1 Tax=Psychroflexus sp. ALD_RP9 TaxID=2777186 RepID=UPI001A9053CA|nr:RluA family pseudouridine synthase [Psychroflexus sp. ALD_RP9]QSS97784.1 RluA family pseudouridine synthase [Psychroflexus sp. ALD_RP9]